MITDWTEFELAYLEALLWSETNELDENGENFSDYSPSDLSPEAQATTRRDCQGFLAGPGIAEAIGDRVQQAGHDFVMTRNGHGCGYWDGDWPDGGEPMNAWAKTFGEANLYLGDDGQLHIFGEEAG